MNVNIIIFLINNIIIQTVMEPTDKDGLCTVKFIYNFCVLPEFEFRIAVIIDDMYAISEKVHFIDKIKIKENCGGLMIISTNITDNTMYQNQNYSIEMQVFGEDGNPLPNAIVAISNDNSVDSITPMPIYIRPYCKIFSAYRFDSVIQFLISD